MPRPLHACVAAQAQVVLSLEGAKDLRGCIEARLTHGDHDAPCRTGRDHEANVADGDAGTDPTLLDAVDAIGLDQDVRTKALPQRTISRDSAAAAERYLRWPRSYSTHRTERIGVPAAYQTRSESLANARQGCKTPTPSSGLRQGLCPCVPGKSELTLDRPGARADLQCPSVKHSR